MTNLEERLALLRVEHAKCKQAAAAHEAQALRIEGAIALVGEMLVEQAKCSHPNAMDVNSCRDCDSDGKKVETSG